MRCATGNDDRRRHKRFHSGSGISDSLNTAAAAALRSIKDRIVISGPVYAELLGSPGRTAEFLDAFCSEAQIHIDWLIGEELSRIAGKEYGDYSERRRKARSGLPRRILADFLIDDMRPRMGTHFSPLTTNYSERPFRSFALFVFDLHCDALLVRFGMLRRLG